jgi:hypothetical protein
MKLKSLAVILLLTVSAFGAVFTSTAGRFSASFVEPPTTASRAAKMIDGTPVTIKSFYAEDASMGEILEYTDLPAAPTPEQLLATARMAFAGRVLDGLGGGEHNGRTWTLAAGHDEHLIYLYAVACVGTRLYEVTIAIIPSPEAKASETAAEAFLDSLKITE